jgi:hypothetical protein
MGLLADFGGISDILVSTLANFFMPLAFHSFMLKMLKRLFYVYTKDNDLLDQEKIKIPKIKASKTLKDSIEKLK